MNPLILTAACSASAPVDTNILTSVHDVVNACDHLWKGNHYEDLPYNPEAVKYVFQLNIADYAHFSPREGKTHGVIQKLVVQDGTKIFVRGDLHGDLKSLIENLKELRRQGLLDENFKCCDNVHLIFLGGYVDRGDDSMHVLQILATMRLENPDHIHLIRGNHEYVWANDRWGLTDMNLQNFLESDRELLEQFYNTMPLTIYVRQDEYVQFTHGLFEFQLDPALLLDGEEALMDVPLVPELSERVQTLASCGGELQAAAQRVTELAQMESSTDKTNGYGIPLTTYNWGDVEDHTVIGKLKDRIFYLSPEDVEAYLKISSSVYTVEMLFRGHQYFFQHHFVDGTAIITTLPVGADCKYYQEKFGKNDDRAYILTTAPEVEQWAKQALTRQAGASETTVSDLKPIQNPIL